MTNQYKTNFDTAMNGAYKIAGLKYYCKVDFTRYL